MHANLPRRASWLAMNQLLVGIGIMFVVWFVGTGVLGCSRRLTAAVPRSLAVVVGAAVLVLALEVTRLFPGSAWPLLMSPVLALCATGSVWFVLHRRGELTTLLGDSVPGLVAALVVTGFFVLPWIVDPSLAGVLHFTSNHDAYHYSSGAQWMLDHSSLDVPKITSTPQPDSDGPAYSSAMQTLAIPLRDGFELLFASTLAATGKSTYAIWPGVAAGMGGLIACAATALAQVARGGKVLSTVAGISVALTALVSFQIANQNAASMFGIAIALAVVVLWITVIGDEDQNWSWAGPTIAGLCLAGLISVYWEGLPSIALILVLVPLASLRRAGFRIAFARAAGAVAVALVAGLVGVWIAIRSASQLSSVNPAGARSPFTDNPFSSGVAWLTGAARYRGPDLPITPTAGAIWLGMFLAFLLLLGLLVALFVPQLWPAPVGAIVALALGWWWWSATSNAYTHRRFVEFAGVVVVAIATAGWVAIPELWSRRRGRQSKASAGQSESETTRSEMGGSWAMPAVAASLVFLAVSMVVSTAASARVLNPQQARGISANFDEVSALVAQRSGNVLVVAPELLNQAWLGLALADRPDTQFLLPCRCLVGDTDQPYLNGQRPKWILLEVGAGSVNGDANLVATSGGIALYEVGPGRVVVSGVDRNGETRSVVYPPLAGGVAS